MNEKKMQIGMNTDKLGELKMDKLSFRNFDVMTLEPETLVIGQDSSSKIVNSR